MNPKIAIESICLLLIISSVNCFSQTRLIEPDIEELAIETSNILNRKKFSGEIRVEPFVNGSGEVTEFTMWIADIVESTMINEGISFHIVTNNLIEESRNRRSADFLDAPLEAIGEGLKRNTNNSDINQFIDGGTELLPDVINLFGGKKSKRNKGLDGLVTGVVYETGETYNVRIKVEEIKGNKATGVAAKSKEIIKPRYSTDMNQTQIDGNSGALATVGRPRLREGGQNLPTFRKDPLFFEFVEAYYQAPYLEVKLKVLCSGQDLNLNLYTGYTKIFIADGSKEFNPESIRLADQRSYNPSKRLLQDRPVDILLTFKLNQEVDLISKLSLSSNTQITGNFYMEMEDLFVD